MNVTPFDIVSRSPFSQALFRELRSLHRLLNVTSLKPLVPRTHEHRKILYRTISLQPTQTFLIDDLAC